MGSFMPQASDASRLAGLGGLAAQIGVNIPAGDPGQSPDFYADLIQSQEVLGSLVDSTYRFRALSGVPGAGNLVSLLKADGDTPEQRREDAIRKLSRRLSVSRNLRTGLIQVRVKTPAPELSREICQRVLDLVNDFNLRQRQARGAAERQFAEERLRTIASELRTAEESLADFEGRNRVFRGSPELSTEHDRLMRAVSMRQQVFTSFSQLYEQARIDALRNTPLITVVDHPRVPARPDSRKGLLKLLLTVVAGGIIALLIAFSRDMTSPQRASSPAGYAQYEELRRAAAADLRHPLRAISRRKHG
jgi:uncharacterized protein involved in exopolysaccharide biosynthesis